MAASTATVAMQRIGAASSTKQAGQALLTPACR
jgi:hypothetical protein